MVEPAVASPPQLLLSISETLKTVLEGLSVATVLVGLLATARQVRPWARRQRQTLRPSTEIRLTFGSWLSMALEFQLGADIVATTTTPTGQNLIQLGVVALIRTFLNVFLAKELTSEGDDHQGSRLQQQPQGEIKP